MQINMVLQSEQVLVLRINDQSTLSIWFKFLLITAAFIPFPRKIYKIYDFQTILKNGNTNPHSTTKPNIFISGFVLRAGIEPARL